MTSHSTQITGNIQKIIVGRFVSYLLDVFCLFSSDCSVYGLTNPTVGDLDVIRSTNELDHSVCKYKIAVRRKSVEMNRHKSAEDQRRTVRLVDNVCRADPNVLTWTRSTLEDRLLTLCVVTCWLRIKHSSPI